MRWYFIAPILFSIDLIISVLKEIISEAFKMASFIFSVLSAS
jgi:hypothetical protein